MINKKNLFHKGLIFMLIFYVHGLKSIKDKNQELTQDKDDFESISLSLGQHLIDQTAQFAKMKKRFQEAGLTELANSFEGLIVTNLSIASKHHKQAASDLKQYIIDEKNEKLEEQQKK